MKNKKLSFALANVVLIGALTICGHFADADDSSGDGNTPTQNISGGTIVGQAGLSSQDHSNIAKEVKGLVSMAKRKCIKNAMTVLGITGESEETDQIAVGFALLSDSANVKAKVANWDETDVGTYSDGRLNAAVEQCGTIESGLASKSDHDRLGVRPDAYKAAAFGLPAIPSGGASVAASGSSSGAGRAPSDAEIQQAEQGAQQAGQEQLNALAPGPNLIQDQNSQNNP